MACRGAASVRLLFTEANAVAPARKKASDGICASQQHHTQNPSSDHEGDPRGIAHAGDLTHSQAEGWDAHKRCRQTIGDVRVKYLISQRKIISYYAVGGYPPWAERPYNGSNGHYLHAHTSIRSGTVYEDDLRPWWPDEEEEMALSDADLQKINTMVQGAAKVATQSLRDDVDELQRIIGPWHGGSIGKALFSKRMNPDGTPYVNPATGNAVYDETTEILDDKVSEVINRMAEMEGVLALILAKVSE